VLQARRAQGVFADEQWQFFFRLRRAEWFSSSSPAAGLGRAIFRGIFFEGLFVLDDWWHRDSFPISVSFACVDGEQQPQEQARGKGSMRLQARGSELGQKSWSQVTMLIWGQNVVTWVTDDLKLRVLISDQKKCAEITYCSFGPKYKPGSTDWLSSTITT
jgi:hypothetical protein